MPVTKRLRALWDVFNSGGSSGGTHGFDYGHGLSSSYNSSRPRFFFGNERSIVSSVYTRIAMDVGAVNLRHAEVDDQGRYSKDKQSELQRCFSLEANLDQAPRAFLMDIVLTLFDSGSAAIVPVRTTSSPKKPKRFDIHELRVGVITNWYPRHVRVSLYNERTGKREEVYLDKRFVAIVENPLYQVMNEPNSVLQRLIRKLGILDAVDEQSGSGKLDLIIQLPYSVRNEQKRQQAETRRQDIEMQLKGSRYGIAYTDGTEKITQLNRPAENNLLTQVEYLTEMLYSQLGISPGILDGTADEQAMLNYTNRTVEPILSAIVQAMQRAWLGAQGIDANERILFFRDPFKLVPLDKIAELADKLMRNEVVTANEVRGWLGLAPSSDPKADELRNANMPQNEEGESPPEEKPPEEKPDSVKEGEE